MPDRTPDAEHLRVLREMLEQGIAEALKYDENEDHDRASWDDQWGVLLTVNEARAVLALMQETDAPKGGHE